MAEKFAGDVSINIFGQSKGQLHANLFHVSAILTFSTSCVN